MTTSYHVFPRTALFLILSGFFLLPVQKVSASHSAGLDLTYTCLGGNEYEVELSFYRFCDGIDAPDDPTIEIESASCGQNLSLDLVQQGTEVDITPVCDSIDTDCANPGAAFNGIEWYKYTGTITLPDNCTDWVFSYDLCCRNSDITTIETPGSEDIHVEATLNNQDFSCNNSPDFTNHPIAYLCAGDTVCFNHGANEIDGDSLVYSFITPTTGNGAGDTVTYMPGYSNSQPISSVPPVTLDSATGDICVSPDTAQVSVMEVKVEEYRNDTLIGAVQRDIQFRVEDCPSDTNTVPALTGINGTGDFQMTVCEGDSVDFMIPSEDPDSNQQVFLNWNGGITGANFDPMADSIDQGDYPLPIGQFQWLTDSLDAATSPHCFTVTVTDDFCDINGSQTYSFCIHVAAKDSLLKNLSISYGSGSFCYDAGVQTPTITGDTTGTFWAEPNGLDIDSSTGEIDVGNGVADSSYMVYYQTADTLLCTGQDSVPITIDTNVVADFHYPDTSYCESYTSEDPVFLNGGSHGIFRSNDTNGLALDTIFGTVDVGNSDTGTYWVYNEIPPSGSCPGDTDSAQIIIEPLPHVSAGPDDTICETEIDTLDGSFWGGASTSTWNTTGDGSFGDPTDTNSTYIPGAMDINNGKVKILIQSDSIKACPTDLDSMELRIQPGPAMNVSSDDTICADGVASVNASLSGTGTGVQWYTTGDGFFDDNSSSSTDYHPGSSDANNGEVTLYAISQGSGECPPDVDSTTVTILPMADPSFHYDMTSICEGKDTTLLPTIDGESGGTFTSSPTGGLDIDSTTGEIEVSGSFVDNYMVTYTVGDQCPDDTTVTFEVKPKPATPSPEPFTVCPEETDTLTVQMAADSVFWYADPDGKELIGTGDSYVPPADSNTPGDHTFYVSTMNKGCLSDMGSVTITVEPYADVNILSDPDPAEGVKQFVVDFMDGSGPNVYDLTIDVGLGGGSNTWNSGDTTVTYKDEGEYTVEVVGFDSVSSCIGRDELTVFVTNEPRANLPNVFTPNGDGKNDVFKPRLDVPCPESMEEEDEKVSCWSGIESFTGTIYNRWGNKVYEWDSWNDAWDGGNASEGTYFYVISAIGENGDKVEHKGKVTLLRNGD